MTLKIAIPNKGRLADESVDLLRKIGLKVPITNDRKLFLNVGGGKYQLLFARSQDIPEFVELGAADIGITGLDLVKETGRKVEKLLDLNFGYCKLIVAVPETSKVSDVDELPNNARVATTFPNLTTKFFASKKKKITLVPISGAAEIAPYLGVADAIVDLTQTGATLKENHLSLVDVIMDSWAALVANIGSLKSKRNAIEELESAINGVADAGRRRYLMANVKKGQLKDVTKIIPGLSGPTVMNIAGKKGMLAIHAVIEEDKINELIPKLKKAGASGILVLPIERMVS